MSRLLWMMMLVSLQLFALPAQAVTRELTLCLEYRKSFVDAEAGDWWTDNTENAKALGVRVTITDDVVSHLRNLSDDTGCTTLDVEVSGSGVLVRAISRSEVEGIEIESYEDAKFFEDQTESLESWQVLVPSDGHTATRELPLEQVWTNLAVAGWIFNRNDFNLGTGTSRDCCTEGSTGYSKDGTCSAANYGTIDPPVRLYEHIDHGCGDSAVEDANDDYHPALAIRSTGCSKKFVLAHELGHVIVGMRQGARQSNAERPADAPLDVCMGSYSDNDPGDTDPPDPVDQDSDPKRGVFTKEYMSMAFREGWGDFIAMWAWNSRLHTDCEYAKQHPYYQDFDLDGDIDNYFGDTGQFSDFNGWIDCRGTPFLENDNPNPMNARNWLADLQDTAYADHCDREAIANHEANRSTVYDVSKMFWELTSDDGYDLNPSVLTDVRRHVHAGMGRGRRRGARWGYCIRRG